MIEPATRTSHSFAEPLSFRVFKNAFVAPYYEWNHSIGGVIDEIGNVVKDSECTEWKENAGYYQLANAEIEHKRVVFLGFLLTGFGHSYTDNLRKLWFLNTKEYDSLAERGIELVYTTSWNRSIPQAVLDVFFLAGIDISSARHITHLTHFDEVIVPDNCFKASAYGRLFCHEYVGLINHIKSSIPDPVFSVPKIYFTRTSFTSRTNKERGEKEIERVFEKLGYKIVAPEDYSVVEQIQMIRGCSHFAATDGSVAHLSLFCKPNTDVVIINKANYLNFHQVMINEFADLNVTYIEAHHSSMANNDYPWWGPFYLCVNHYLEHFVQHPILHLPYWARYSYWEYTRNIIFKCYNRIRKVLYRLFSVNASPFFSL